jgi:hypothetical protein
MNINIGLNKILVIFTVFYIFAFPAFALTKYEQRFTASFPSTILDWEQGKITDFEKDSPGAGAGISYSKTNAWADIYIYTNSLAKIPAGNESKIVNNAFANCIDNKYYLQKQGVYQSVEAYETGIRRVGLDHKTTLLFSKFILTVNNSEKIDVIYLTAVKNHFFKILLTYDNSALTEKDLKSFLDSVWDLIYLL